MQHIKDALKSFMKSSGIGGRAEWRDIEERWAEFAPEAPASVKPVKLEKGRLIVVVPNSAVMNEMAYAKAKILSRLKKALGSAAVKEITLRIAQ